MRDPISITKILIDRRSIEDSEEPFNRWPSKQKHGRLIPYGWTAFKPCRIKGRGSKSSRKASGFPLFGFPRERNTVISFREREASIASGIKLSLVVGKSRESRKRGRKRRRDVSTPVYRCFIGVFSLLSSPTFHSPLVYFSIDRISVVASYEPLC